MRQLIERLLPVSKKSYRILAMVLIAVGLLLSFFSCATSSAAFLKNFAPNLPADYYNCIDVNPDELYKVYFSGYTNSTAAEVAYNDRYFVFKDMVVTDWMIVDKDKGWLWVSSGTKCLFLETAFSDTMKLGDRIDLVGYNTGIVSGTKPGLLFKDCYVLPAGAVQLPAGTGGGFVPAY